MPNPGMSTDDIRQLEECEIAAWTDLFQTASKDDIDALGLEYHKIGHGIFSAAAKVDVLALNRALGLGFESTIDEDLIDMIIDRFSRLRVRRFFIQADPVSQSKHLVEALSAKGFSHYNNWVRLYLDIAEAPEVKSDLRVEQISSEHADAFAEIVTQSFNWPSEIKSWVEKSIGRANWRHYMAFDAEKPVATGAMYIHNELAWFSFASTLSDYRGRGAQGALIARRISDASKLGCKRIAVETAEDKPEKPSPSNRNMLRFGFKVAYVRPNYIHVRN
jgi:GNAT superfamily N-acetyltransferase